MLSDYLEDALPPRRRARVAEHLATCPDCVAYLEQLRVTVGVVDRLREADFPAGILRELMAAFRGWRRD